MPQRANLRFEHEVAIGFEVHSIDPVEGQAYGARVRAGAEHEVIFELLLVAVKDQGYARVQAAVCDAPKARYVSDPAGGYRFQ